jgi:hypothetical protein
VAGGFPDPWVHEDRRIESFNIFAERHRPPPLLFYIPQKFNAQRTVIPAAIQASVNLTGLEDKSPALAEGNDLLHYGCTAHLLCWFLILGADGIAPFRKY